jgi:hypothetical protein
LGDGHINLVDGIAVLHIPVSSMEKWKPTTNSSGNANVPAEVEVKGKGKGKKRAATASTTPSRDEKSKISGLPLPPPHLWIPLFLYTSLLPSERMMI